jgi:hypothetical protein
MADAFVKYEITVLDDGTATVTTKNISKKIKDIGVAGEEAGGKIVSGMKNASAAVEVHNRTMERLQRTAIAFIGMWALTKVLAFPKELIESGIKFNSTLEDSRLGIASILVASGEFVDSTGRGVTGWDKMNAAMSLSGDLIEKIKVKNLETYATLEQIVKAYQSGLAFGLQKSAGPEQMLDYTVAMVKAAGALRMNLDMLAEEMRSLMTGVISPRTSFIATALRITPADIQKYQGDVNGLLAYIQSRLEAFNYAGVLAQKTWTGLVSNVKDAVANAMGEGMQPLFDYLKVEMAGIQGYIIHLNKQTNLMELNPNFIEDLKSVANVLVWIIEQVERVIKGIGSLYSGIREIVQLASIPVLAGQVAYKQIKKDTNSILDFLGFPSATEEQKLISDVQEHLGIKLPKSDATETDQKDWLGLPSIQAVDKWTAGILKQTRERLSAKLSPPKEIGLMRGGAGEEEAGALSGRGKLAYQPRLVTMVNQEAADILMKMTAETGKADQALVEYVAQWDKMKDIGGDVLGLHNKQLEVAMKTAREYDEAKKNTQALFPPGVLERAYTDLMRVRVAIAGIEEKEEPLKIIGQIAQVTNQYDLQESIILRTNEYEKQKLLLHKTITPEIQKQISAMNELAEIQVKEVEIKRMSESINLTKDILSQSMEYAKLTGNIEDQLRLMKEIEDQTVKELYLQLALNGNEEERLKILQKISETRKTGGETRRQAEVSLPITIYKQPLAQVGMQFAEATGNIEMYTKNARENLEYTIDLIRNTATEAEKNNGILEERISLMRQVYVIEEKIKKTEMETYGSDILANAANSYAGMTGNLELQNDSQRTLLDNELKRLNADQKIGLDQYRQISNYKEMSEEVRKLTAELSKQKEILGWQKDLATLQGDYLGSKDKEIDLLENERKTLIANNIENWKAVEAINAYYDKLTEIARAERNMNPLGLISQGLNNATIKANQDLVDSIKNTYPNMIDSASSGLSTFLQDWITGAKSAKDAWNDFAKSFGQSVLKMITDLALLIVKTQLYNAIGVQMPGEGTSKSSLGSVFDVIKNLGGLGLGETSMSGTPEYLNQTLTAPGEVPTFQLGNIRGFAQGTDFVPKTGIALVHHGEGILSPEENAKRNREGGNPTPNVIIYYNNPSIDTQTGVQFLAQHMNILQGAALAAFDKAKRTNRQAR